MKLHVLTACSRPENLGKVSASLAGRREILGKEWLIGMDVEWHLLFDLDRQHVGGQALKNRMLDGITDGWVWILDDDTLVHPKLLPALEQRLPLVRPNLATWEAIVVSQKRSDGGILLACRENCRVGHIDIGQAILRRDLIGDERIPLTYDGDGLFLEKVLAGAEVVFLNDVLSFHNALA